MVERVLTRQEFYAQYPNFSDLPWGSPERDRWLAAHPGAAAQWTAIRDVESKMAQVYGEQWRNTAGEQWSRVVADYLDGGFGDKSITAAAGAPTSAATAAPAAVGPARNAAADASARAVINGMLSSYGLGGLGDWAWQQYLNGTPTSQIMLDLRTRPEYAQRFPGMAELANRGQAISEDQYIALESTYRATFRSYGIPTSFYDGPEDFGRYIANGKSPKELAEQLDMAEQVAATDPRGQQLRDEMTRLYQLQGLNVPATVQGAITAWFIDPDKAQTLIERQFRSAVTAAASQRTGFGQLTLGEAEEIAGYGTTEEAAQQTFGQLAGMGEFQSDLVGQSADAVSRQELLQAGFAGNATAQQKIERTRRRRQGAFQGGGGFAAGERGISGLGTAT